MKDTRKSKVVISGISGRFPESSSLKEFIANLLENRDLVTSNSRRFKPGLYGLPKGYGTLKELDKFDAEFFCLLPKQADIMDPQLRIGLETTYEAMFDAGVNPEDERGSRTGVFTAIISHEAMELWSRKPDRMDGANLISSLGTMLPNRISYCFDFTGPSASYDTACSSSIFALDAAVTAIETGKCDSAIVMGACLIINPTQSVMRNDAGMLAKDSVPRTFDPDGLGYVRAEAVATIYLQKMSDAKKAYVEIVGIGTNTDGNKERGIFYPSAMMQEKLLEEVYASAGVDPTEVTYLEAHGTGTPAGDPEEVRAASRHFCLNKQRKTPLLIGSVKSNIGHAEAASGLCAIAKIVTILQHGIIPGNLHYKKPHYSMKNIREGKIQVVHKNTEWNGGYIGLSCFGFGGVNTHAILKPILGKNPSNGHILSNSVNVVCGPKNIDVEPLRLQLATLEGRTRDGVEKNLKEIMESGHQGQLFLLNEINRSSMKGKFRAYGIIGTETIDVKESPAERPSIWFIMNGMGSQWTGMGRSLFQIPIFKSSFDQCCEALQPFGYNLLEIYSSDDPTIFDVPTNTFACIGATQIGLIDILRLLGIKPDGMLGHSMGETLCAYADECITLKETIVSIYLRGKPCENLKDKQVGSYGMAAVTISPSETTEICPPGLFVACHNAPDSTTISGPLELIEHLSTKLSKFGIQAKVVNSSGLSFHSKYVAPAVEEYIKILKPFLKDRARSHKWISTSVPQEKWETVGKTFGCDYLRNNFLSPVLFMQALKHIPPGAVIIEIGACGLLRGIIQKQTKDSTVIPLQSRNTDGLLALQNALGRLFVSGINYDLNKLSGLKVQRPLPGNTPLLGHLVDWDHSQSWGVPDYSAEIGGSGGVFDVCLSRKEDVYLAGHVICGRVLYPASGYLYLVWKHFAASLLLDLDDVPVTFEDVKFLRVTVMRSTEITEFHVNLLPAGGMFEVKESGIAVCTGRIRLLIVNEEKISEAKWNEIQTAGIESLANTEDTQTTVDVYKRLRFLGYDYAGQFKGIQKVDHTGSYFFIGHKSNWISFIDILLQTTFRIYSARGYPTALTVPTEISKIFIHPSKFSEGLSSCPDGQESSVFVNYDAQNHIVKCRGIEIEGLTMTKFSSRRHEMPTVISHHSFDPYKYADADVMNNDKFTPLLRCVSIIMENFDKLSTTTPTILEICTKGQTAETLEITNLIRIHFAMPDIDYTMCVDDISAGVAKTLNRNQVKIQNVADTMSSTEWMGKKYDIIIMDEAIFTKKAIGGLRKGGFFVLKTLRGHNTLEEIQQRLDSIEEKFHIISHKFSNDYDVFLIRRDTKLKCKKADVVFIDNSLEWIEPLAKAMNLQEQHQMEELPCPRLYIVSTGNFHCGILGLTLCIRKEPFSRNVRCIYSKQKLTLDFEFPDEILQEILDKDLVFNVMDDSNRLGCYIHSEISSNDRTTRTSSAFIEIKTPGDLASFRWSQGIQLETLPSILGLVPVDVAAAALNFHDMMISSGNMAPDLTFEFPHCHQCPLGYEFAGTTKSGRKVCGITHAQGLATQVLASESLLWGIPEKWTFEEASTIPIAYSTAYFALVMRGHIRENESILIHLGAGSVGIAAIRIALAYNCQIFTTVGTEKKKDWIKTTFPEIPEHNIGHSRDNRFEQLVLSRTKGRGVDLILNSVTGNKLSATVRCLAQHGRFLEIGRSDLVQNKSLGMKIFLKDASFHGINLNLMLREGHPADRRTLVSVVQEGIDSGVVQPLPFRAFLRDQIEPAFRFLGQGSQIGKIIIAIRQAQDETAGPITVLAEPKAYFSPNKSYIILGGLGGVGLELINWMTQRNARNVLIVSRTGQLTPYSRNYIKIWKERGVNVRVMAQNAMLIENIQEIFRKAMSLAPIGGIFNLTLHLDIKLMKHQTPESFQAVIDPKITITRHLDDLSRQLCPELDHFIIFSSVSSALGFDGQGNYGFANSGAERLVERRIQDGYPARAIQWGPIGEVGAWHKNYNQDFQRTDFHGTAVQSISSALRSLDLLLTLPGSPVSFCRKIVNLEATDDMGVHLEEVNLIERVAHILGHSSAAKINSKHKLVDLGMDSIMSIEVTHVLKADFGLELSAGEIRGYTLEQLNEMSNNSRNERATISAGLPKLKSATAGLVQLNLFKTITKSRFVQTEALYPINQLAKDGIKQPGLPTVLICNSIEGPDVLRVLGALTKAPAYSLQFSSLADKAKSFQEIGDLFMESISNENLQGPFIVAGLSAGVFPAYELGIRLQKTGQIKKLIWLDMTFDRFKAVIRENFGDVDDISEVNETDIMVFCSIQMFGFDKTTVENILREQTTQQGKLDKLVELMQEICDGELNEGMQDIAKVSYKPMFNLLGKYGPTEMFTEKTALVKTSQNLIADDIGEFWGLEKICTKPVEVLIVDTTHSYLIAEPAVRKVVELINNSLNED